MPYSVLEPHLYGIAGETPVFIYLADERRVVSISRQGHAPKKAAIEWFEKNNINTIPGDGLLAATIPDSVSSWITALMHFGTMRLSDILEPAIELAEHGFPMYGVLQSAIQQNSEKVRGGLAYVCSVISSRRSSTSIWGALYAA